MTNIYFDDSLYEDNISVHDIVLFGGMKHVLKIKSYPDPKVPPFVLDSEKNYVCKEGDAVVIDLTDVDDEYDSNGYFSFDMGIILENNFVEKRKVHIYRPKNLDDLAGVYKCPDIPGKSITVDKDGTVTIDLDDRIDGVEPFSGKFEFNPFSFKFKAKENFPSQTVEDVEFTLFAYISYDPKKSALKVAAQLSAFDGYNSDSSYLIGFGDEDSGYEYDSFVNSEEAESK